MLIYSPTHTRSELNRNDEPNLGAAGQALPAGREEGPVTRFKTHLEAEQEAKLKRLARIDRHTLLEGEMAELRSCSNEELTKLCLMREASMSIRVEAAAILRKRLDPEDQDAVEV